MKKHTKTTAVTGIKTIATTAVAHVFRRPALALAEKLAARFFTLSMTERLVVNCCCCRCCVVTVVTVVIVVTLLLFLFWLS